MVRSVGSRGRELPVAVIGAGPIGLAAAAHLVERGETPLVLEAGDAVAASVRSWSHVRLFSPWKYLVDPVARAQLEAAGWSMPDGERLPTGGELVERYLEPLAALPSLAGRIRLGARVEAVTRRGYDKVKTAGREEAPFELVVRTAGGGTERVLARAVIDASGTYATPNPVGSDGLPVEGERDASDRIHYGIPDVLGRDRARYAGKRTVVVGSGHSAFNALLALVELAEEVAEDLPEQRAERGPAGEVVWAIRRSGPGTLFGGEEKDELSARGRLGTRLREVVESGRVRVVTDFRTTGFAPAAEGLLVEGEGRVIGPVDEVVVTTGYRPDLPLTRELRLELDPWLEAPVRLAPLIDPNEHSCGTVYPHGAAELSHPERDYWVVGMKSYGRAPTFLLLTGYEQVRSVVCSLVGDEEGARDVRLVLPETGVCSTDLVAPGVLAGSGAGVEGTSCCGDTCCA